MSPLETAGPRPLHELLNELYADFVRWVVESRAEDSALEIVWNQDLNRFRDPSQTFRIKWIVVGHNPGTRERGAPDENGVKLGRYFHPEGSTGSWTRLILAHEVRCLQDQVLFLEKTPIHSANVEGLRPMARHRLFNEIQERMAQAVHDVQEATGAFVWIQGYLTTRDLFESFFSTLGGLYDDTDEAQARKRKVFKTRHLLHLMQSGSAFPVERLLEEGLATALTEVPQFEPLP